MVLPLIEAPISSPATIAVCNTTVPIKVEFQVKVGLSYLEIKIFFKSAPSIPALYPVALVVFNLKATSKEYPLGGSTGIDANTSQLLPTSLAFQ
jgi:hypothetical protein